MAESILPDAKKASPRTEYTGNCFGSSANDCCSDVAALSYARTCIYSPARRLRKSALPAPAARAFSYSSRASSGSLCASSESPRCTNPMISWARTGSTSNTAATATTKANENIISRITSNFTTKLHSLIYRSWRITSSVILVTRSSPCPLKEVGSLSHAGRLPMPKRSLSAIRSSTSLSLSVRTAPS